MRLPIDQVYSWGLIKKRTNRYTELICSICDRRTCKGLTRKKSENQYDACVGAVVQGWQLPATGTYCDKCQKLKLYPALRALGWIVNFLPLPVIVFVLILLVNLIVYVVLDKIYEYEYRQVEGVVVVEETV